MLFRMAEPTITITKRTSKGTPIRGACPLCDSEFSTEAFDNDESYAHERTLNADFAAHMKQVHTREDVNQAAFRVMRESTSDAALHRLPDMAQRGLAKAILTDIHFVIPVLVLLGGIVLLVKLH